MSRRAGALTLARHLLILWRAGQLRFRLETFGLYHPALPYTQPWWRPSRTNLLLILLQSRAYACWILEMEELRVQGAESWWRHLEPKGRS